VEQGGLAPCDLIPFIGNRNRVCEVLSRKRPLTLAMVRRLHEGLGIPAESLIKAGGDDPIGRARRVVPMVPD
jgi:HTH-type transcriptional regulator/antitoxin HigA